MAAWPARVSKKSFQAGLGVIPCDGKRPSHFDFAPRDQGNDFHALEALLRPEFGSSGSEPRSSCSRIWIISRLATASPKIQFPSSMWVVLEQVAYEILCRRYIEEFVPGRPGQKDDGGGRVQLDEGLRQ